MSKFPPNEKHSSQESRKDVETEDSRNSSASSYPSSSQDDGRKSSSGNKSTRINFPWKMHQVLRECEENEEEFRIVSWLPNGIAFKVHNKAEFAAKIMPRYFGSTKYKTFQRSMNIWGFQTIMKGTDRGAVHNPLFQKDRAHLCQMMGRNRSAMPVGSWASLYDSSDFIREHNTNIDANVDEIHPINNAVSLLSPSSSSSATFRTPNGVQKTIVAAVRSSAPTNHMKSLETTEQRRKTQSPYYPLISGSSFPAPRLASEILSKLKNDATMSATSLSEGSAIAQLQRFARNQILAHPPHQLWIDNNTNNSNKIQGCEQQELHPWLFPSSTSQQQQPIQSSPPSSKVDNHSVVTDNDDNSARILPAATSVHRQPASF